MVLRFDLKGTADCPLPAPFSVHTASQWFPRRPGRFRDHPRPARYYTEAAPYH